MAYIVSAGLARVKLIAVCCALVALGACESKDHQVATLEKDSGMEQYLEAGMGENPEERFVVYRQIMHERLEKNQEYAERFKMDKVNLKKEERAEYEEAIDSIEVEISSMREELESFGTSDGEEWNTFIENFEQQAQKIEDDLRQLTIHNSSYN